MGSVTQRWLFFVAKCAYQPKNKTNYTAFLPGDWPEYLIWIEFNLKLHSIFITIKTILIKEQHSQQQLKIRHKNRNKEALWVTVPRQQCLHSREIISRAEEHQTRTKRSLKTCCAKQHVTANAKLLYLLHFRDYAYLYGYCDHPVLFLIYR